MRGDGHRQSTAALRRLVIHQPPSFSMLVLHEWNKWGVEVVSRCLGLDASVFGIELDVRLVGCVQHVCLSTEVVRSKLKIWFKKYIFFDLGL